MFRRNGKYDLNLPLNLRVSIRIRSPRTCNRDLFSHRIGLMPIDRMPSSIPASILFYFKRSVAFFYRIVICPYFFVVSFFFSRPTIFPFFFYNFTARKRDAFDPVFAVAAAVTRLRARKVSLFLSNARVSTPRRRRFNIYRSSPANLHGSLVINSRRVLRAFQPSTPGIMRLLRQFRGSKLQKY